MELNEGKCELVWHRRNARDDLFPPTFAPKDKDKRQYDNFALLGSPIGDADFCNKWLRDSALAKGTSVWAGLEFVEDLQVRYTLLRSCATTGLITHLLRTVPPTLCGQAVTEFDEAVKRATSSLLAVDVGDSWPQMTLPTSLGGVGLRSARAHAFAAYASSVAFAKQQDGGAWADYEGFGAARDALLSAGCEMPPDDAPWTQATFSCRIDGRSLDTQIAAADVQTKARLMSVSAEGAGAWLNVIPNGNLGQQLANNEFSVLIRWWLGLDVYPQEHQCPLCRNAMCGKNGYHSLTCRFGGHLGIRHHALRNVIFRAAQVACLEPRLETPFLLPGGSERPADVQLGDRCCDVAVTHPLQPKYLLASAAARGSAVEAYASDVKCRKYSAACSAANLVFVPLVVSAFGEWSDSSRPIFKEIASRIAAHKGISFATAKAQLTQRLSIALMRGNARALLQRTDPLTQELQEPTDPPQVELPNLSSFLPFLPSLLPPPSLQLTLPQMVFGVNTSPLCAATTQQHASEDMVDSVPLPSFSLPAQQPARTTEE
jgi:hypothetical protein